MRKLFLFFILTAIPWGYLSLGGLPSADSPETDGYALYLQMGLEGMTSYEAFNQALEGYRRIDRPKKNIVTLIDFTKPSTEQRLFVLDMEAHRILYSSLVSHGRGSGENYATSFSNVSGSHKSSLGFFLTGQTYQGGNGYSLLLEGLEKGINDRARERAIVIHGADYCNPEYAASAGRLGRSFGCPALPRALTRSIIDAIKGGTLLYIYAANPAYMAQSALFSGKNSNRLL